MRKFFRLYRIYTIQFFKARAEYRLNFWLGILANIYSYFITFLNYWIITRRFENIDGWGFADMSILYGINLFTYAIAGTFVWYNAFQLEEEIISGGLDRYLVRPMGVIEQLICSRFGDTFVGQVIVAGIFLTWAMFKHISLLSIGKVLYFFLILISGTMLQIGAMIVVGSLSFWLNKSTKIGEVFYYEIRSLIHYPLSIYPVWIRYLLTYLLPWAFINYYPALLLLGKGNSVIDYVFPAPPRLLLASPRPVTVWSVRSQSVRPSPTPSARSLRSSARWALIIKSKSTARSTPRRRSAQ